jgi:hypothetical protein
MRRLFALVVSVLALVVASCSYDDTAIWDKVNNLEDRVAKLEELCKKANSDIEALQTIVEALQQNDYVTSVAPIMDDGKTIGYTITFAKSGDISIYNGKDGANGGGSYIPNIGVKKDTDGIYYWTLDGEWLLDSGGNKVRVQGVNGAQGEQGAPGDDGITPKLKIENDYWYVSYDNGATWSVVGKATAEGTTSSDSIFDRVEIENGCVVFYLKDGTSFTVPTSDQTDGDIIRFLDNAVKIRCVVNWDTDGDNELSKAEAAKVTSLDHVFERCDAIVAFDELKYFTGLTEIEPYEFREAFNLHKITLPESIKSIGEWAFAACYRLKQLNINEGVTKIGCGAFEGCRSLKSITIPGSVEDIQVKYKEYYDDGEFDINYENPFEDCYSLEAIYSPYASDGRSLIMDNTLIYVASAGINEYTIPAEVKSVANNALGSADYDSDGVRFPKVVIPESVEYIDFYGLCAVEYHFESMTPPSMHEDALGNWYDGDSARPVIYIPDGALPAYLASDWREMYKNWIYFDGPVLPVPADPDPSNLAFNHRVVLIDHCAVNDMYSPMMLDNLYALEQTNWYDHYNLVTCHAGLYASVDPANSAAANALNQMQSPSGYPTINVNFYTATVGNYSTSSFVNYASNTLTKCVNEDGADVGVAMAVGGDCDNIYCVAQVKANVAQEYKAVAWLLESDIYSPNQAGATKEYHRIYNYALRNISGEYSKNNVSGESIGVLAQGKTKNLAFELPITSAMWNTENMGVLVIVSAKDKNGRWEVANTAYCPVGETKAYEYVE